MKLGFVGTGRWAQKLKAAFEAEGAVVTRHCNSGRTGPLEGWGDYFRWAEQVTSSQVDALVVTAPPEVTTEVALACAAAGKPVMATKPLMLERPVPIRAPFYVDFWRLWSDALHRLSYNQTDCRIQIVLEGSGPIRDFPGLLDYGPHAFAYLRKLRNDFAISSVREVKCKQGELFIIEGAHGKWEIRSGNGALTGCRQISGHSEKGRYIMLDETPTELSVVFRGHRFIEKKDQLLRAMCRSFMNDVSEGFVTTEHLDLSCAVMRDLAEVRRQAEAAQ